MRMSLSSLAAIGLAILAASLAEARQAAAPQADAPKTKPRERRDDDAPRVLTPEEAEARKRSPFLRPPGDDGVRYEEDRDLPPWSARASFFGIAARGRFFVYVLDHSESMVDAGRIARATIELRRSVAVLRDPQQFEVIFYNDETATMSGGPIPRTADSRNKRMLGSWLGTIEPEGGTRPRAAVLQALALRPDAVFLLSDGDFPAGVVEAIAAANKRRIPIHCVDLAGGLAGDALPRIARDSGGRYASRPGGIQGATGR